MANLVQSTDAIKHQPCLVQSKVNLIWFNNRLFSQVIHDPPKSPCIKLDILDSLKLEEMIEEMLLMETSCTKTSSTLVNVPPRAMSCTLK